MTGVEKSAIAAGVYGAAGYGAPVIMDLGTELYTADPTVLIGGPPCRPWSAVNQQRRGAAHEDHSLIDRFVDHVRVMRPEVFVMENVPALASDAKYIEGLRRLMTNPDAWYGVDRRVIRYDIYGASTRRRRLFTIGVRHSTTGPGRIFELLTEYQRPARTVRDAIHWLRDVPRAGVIDHDWSQLRSIHKYTKRYATGQYGWAKLRYDEAAPSFGSVAKTYILHPEAGDDGYPRRVISVREVLSIMGFGEELAFNEGTPRSVRYQMAANAVSPAVSEAVGRAVRAFLIGT